MNPDESIKIWLLTAGEQYGIEQCHDYQWDDASTRPDQPWFTYRLQNIIPIQRGVQDKTTTSGNTATFRVVRDHETAVRIDLYKDKAGLHHLAAIATAAVGNPVIKALLKAKGCEFKDVVSIENMTPENLPKGEREEKYHHRMFCTFDEMVGHSMDETNAVVDRIQLRLFSDGPTFNITEDGFYEAFILTAGSGDIVISGSATLTVS